MQMDSIVPFFGRVSQESNDEADLVDFLHQGIAEVGQINLDIM